MSERRLILGKPIIVRQKSLFDDESSDLIYLKEELRRRRLKEIKKEKSGKEDHKKLNSSKN